MRNADDFDYSEIYFDEFFEYRHVTGPKELETRIRRLLKEDEWRRLGIRMSAGWMNYDIHPPEQFILLFKRPRGFLELPRAEQLKWINQVNKLIAEKNAFLIRKQEQNSERRASLRESTVQRNVPFGGEAENVIPAETRSPLSAISHLYY